MNTTVLFSIFLLLGLITAYPITDTSSDTVIDLFINGDCFDGIGPFSGNFPILGAPRSTYSVRSYFAIFLDFAGDCTDDDETGTDDNIPSLEDASVPTIAPYFANWEVQSDITDSSVITHTLQTGASPLDGLVGMVSQEWFRVTYEDTTFEEARRRDDPRVNTVQQITMTDRTKSVTCFIYPDEVESGSKPGGGLSWDTGDDRDGLSGDKFARVGFSDGDGTFFELAESGTDAVRSLDGVQDGAPAATTEGLLEGLYCFDVTNAVVTPLEVFSCGEVCDDNLSCTVDTCVDGECVFTPSNDLCDDGFSCTTNVCNPNDGESDADGCVFTPVDSSCDDTFSCTTDTCNPESGEAGTGCLFTPVDSVCDDSISCTVDTCNTESGEAGTGCLFTETDSNCDDSISCTVDTCDVENGDATTGCLFTETDSNCDDGFSCTTDTCDVESGDATTGCLITPNDSSCNDNVGCTTDTCNPESGDATTGCLFTPVDSVCDDSIPCTDNICDLVDDCIFVNNDDNCPRDGLENECTANICAPNSVDVTPDANGCIYPGFCDDFNLCTIDSCAIFTIEESVQAFCFYNDVDCDDFDLCTNSYCDTETGNCVHEEVVCNDNDPTTVDTCDRLDGCIYTPIDCNDQDDDDACTERTLNVETGECDNNDISDTCDDGNPCTDDYCDSMRGCQITFVNCDDGLICTTDYCEAVGGEPLCVNEEKDCDSENPGTVCSEELFGECVEVTP